MTAYGFTAPYDAGTPWLAPVDLPPEPLGRHDIRVDVRAVATNPVDVKVRRGALDGWLGAPSAQAPRVIGYDAAGLVTEAGPDAAFAPGDAVMYAGDVTRPGSFADSQVVDGRIVGPKPANLSFREAAALPLTAITAWEMLFERFALPEGAEGVLLVTGAAGGVGSILVQIARALTGMTVIATASRPATEAWVREMGAHHVIDHHGDMPAQLAALDVGKVTHVASLTHTDVHLPALEEMLAVGGRICAIDDPDGLDVMSLKGKALSFHWEMMFARPVHGAAPERQGALLHRVAQMVEAGTLRGTATRRFDGIDPRTLGEALDLQASGTAIGKIVLGEG
ncbi:MAG: zinc-binding alcohol dehydrogenase family protein [Pseudomonadota bacterium]